MEKILVVDDNFFTLKFICSMLEGLYHAVPAISGRQALEIAVRDVPDLILLDIEMPDMNGFEVLAQLRRKAVTSLIPVIFLTAASSPEFEIRALESGAQDFLTKSFAKSVLIHRIELHLRLSRYHNHLERTVRELEDSIVVSFADMIECRDENTGGHVQRTARYMDILGRFLRLSGHFTSELQNDELDMMVRAAPLHDIGKIGIKDAILLKPGKLDDAEFLDMQRHALIGASILDAMHKRLPAQRYLAYAKTIAESHHERFDGKGYPQGIAGEDIPLCSRIMAVVDVYDALVSDRIYRRAMSHEEAMAMILDGRGKNFDPRVVDVLVENGAFFKGGAQ